MSANDECDELVGRLLDAIDAEEERDARMQLQKARRARCLDKGTSGAVVRALSNLEFDRARREVDRAVQMGDLRPEREQPTLGDDESGRRDRRRTTRESRRESPDQGQTQFGEGGDLEGQERLGGGFAGPRERRERDDDDDRERRDPTEGVRSLREFARRGDDDDDDDDSR